MKRKRASQLMAIIIALLAVLAPAETITAADSVNTTAQIIQAMGIMNTERGSSNSESATVTRAEFAQMLTNMSTLKDTTAAKSNTSLFKDVSKDYWASGYIETAITWGWMSGYLDGTFMPNKAITLQEAVNGVLKLLGYTSADFTGSIGSGQMALYTSKGLNANISKTAKQTLTRKDISNLLYNTLTTTGKDGKIYAETLGYSLDENGEINYLSVINTDMEGPIVADANWKTEIPFSITSSVTFYRNETKSNLTEIEEYDVLYYSENINTIWAYDNKVTGTVKDIYPNRLSPSSVNIGGNEYTIGTNSMAYEFSTLGNVDAGDTVTILLGKEDTVVGVLSLDEYNTTITGIVTKTGEHMSTDEEGDYIYTNYVEFVDAKGSVFQQDYDMTYLSFSEGNIARVTYKDGEASVSKYEMESRNFGDNTFSSDASMLGGIPLASNVKILDYSEGNYITIYPDRLANVVLGGSTVLYYEMNSIGEITQLILNNVTGDLYEYGVITGITFTGSGTATLNYMLNGTSYTTNPQLEKGYNLDAGPKGFLFEGNILSDTLTLTAVDIVSVGTATVQSSDGKYPMSDNVLVYYLVNGKYAATTLDKVSDKTKYELTGYYDKTILTGGQVRVIIAEKIN
ncbi:MAG: hypothetical protein K0R92_1677 [Lachnospiraceae bacterium]|nr:hypothetical protein [Lachnospiraceae bacterium]